MNIFSDVNLDQISFSMNGRDLVFIFLNMTDGAQICEIKCASVYLFRYDNSFKNDDDGFACYVGEVSCHRIPRSYLKSWNYERYEPSEDDLFHFYIEGGEISISLACEKVIVGGNQIMLESLINN